MTNIHENLQPDSEVFETLAVEEIKQKTDSGLRMVFDEEMEKSSSGYIIEEVKRLNPEVKFESDFDRGLIFSSVDIEKLNLPE